LEPCFALCTDRAAGDKQRQCDLHAQQADPDFAATHGGKTFDQFYGSGKKTGTLQQLPLDRRQGEPAG